MSEKQAVIPKPAATILVCRDTPRGLETFMVVRHHQIDFASGALVFPGGKIAEGDAQPEVREFCDGADELDDTAFGLRVAAIREVFEESGLLLARDETGAHVSAARLEALERYREPLAKNEAPVIDLLRSERLRLACDALHPFAHWVTPEMMPKRFDTHFFLARAPEDQIAVHDGSESVDSTWITPSRVLKEAEEGKWTVIFPTRSNLEMLGRSATVDEAIAAAQQRTIVTVLPWVEDRDDGPTLCIPPEAGYRVSEEKLANLRGEGSPKPQ